MSDTPTPDEPESEPGKTEESLDYLMRESQRLIEDYTASADTDSLSLLDGAGIAAAFAKATEKLLADPDTLMARQKVLWEGTLRLWQQAASGSPGPESDSGDRRFADPAWKGANAFNLLKQFYLLWSDWLEGTYSGVEGLDEATKNKVRFYTRQMVAAASPSNFAATNPVVMRESVESDGMSLIRGLDQLRQDMDLVGGIRMVAEDAFEVGKTVAMTPGKIVFQNRLMQLIQYAPTTQTVHARPVLIVPPWINKYYILDLTPQKSFVAYLVEQGFTVFLVSWVNPDASLRDVSFVSYMEEGILAARDAVAAATGEPGLNILGYCVGGTLLAATLAYLVDKGDKTVHSATFLATLVDFADAGDIKTFIDEDQIARVEHHMERTGVFEGKLMATAFNMLRPNDLIWSFVINNYLRGREPKAFDLLFWNSDATNLPAAMHSFYLRNMYLNNRLSTPGEIELNGVPIDIGKITVPAFVVATKDDHISPWRSAYLAPLAFGGKSRFVLAKSGHVAGVVNPPAAEKYSYWTNPKLPDSADEWFERAEEHAGSWWPDWVRWLRRRSGKKVPARAPGGGGLATIEDAPGSYVMKRCE